MRYIKLMSIIPLVLSCQLCLADVKVPPLNTVKLQLNDEAWVTTKTAKLVIAIDATLNQAQLANIQTQILTNLKKIVLTENWHITQFNRSKDQSDLERLQVLAEARVAEAELASVSEKVATVSKPGAAYKIMAIEFTPSMAEIEQVRAKLRTQMYQQVKAELASLNNVYPEMHYFVHAISFREQIGPMVPANNMLALAQQRSLTKVNDIADMQLSNQLQLTAEVILATKIKH